MTKAMHSGRRKASALGKTGAARSAHVMKPEYLAEIERTIRQMRGKKFGDGTHIIYVNGATRSETEIGKLVHDLLCRDAAEMYFDLLRKRVSEFKNSEEGRHYIVQGNGTNQVRGQARG